MQLPVAVNRLLYHVMAHGNDGQKIFLRQSDYQASSRDVGLCASVTLSPYGQGGVISAAGWS
jgi:hypothetical protein